VQEHRETRLDWLSAIPGGIVALVYAPSEAATGGWGSGLVPGLLGAAVVVLSLILPAELVLGAGAACRCQPC
jgi:hypothetical protein